MKPVTILLALAFARVTFAAPDESVLGKSDGYPICKTAYLGGLDQRCYVGNLSHYDQIVPARTVAKSSAARPFGRAENEPQLRYVHQGRAGSVDSFLNNNRNTGLLVIKDDTILVERYQYDRNPQHRFTSMSMAKTVVGMLIGIALEEKKIGSIEDFASQYVPELKGHPYGETTLRHLLTMSSGVNFSDPGADSWVLIRKTLFAEGPGGVDSVLPFKERANPPGTKFQYSSAESQVLSLVLRAVVGEPLAEYLSEKIWQPMGAEADATWLLDSSGQELGYMGLNATLRDWGRFGMLLANGGAVDGKQIIPAAWVRAATTAEAPHLTFGVARRLSGYGYQTWLIHPSEPYFALLGVRGQSVIVDPKSKIVVVHTAVHATEMDPSLAEQFSLFFGVLTSLKQP